ncbi:transmembrane protein 43-like [Saccoglossus kowalevskii]
MYRANYPDAPGMHNPLVYHPQGARNQVNKAVYSKLARLLEQIGRTFGTTGFGLVIFISAIVIVFWNEERVVKTSRTIEEALGLVIPLKTNEVAFEENNHKLVHMTGELRTDMILVDLEYGIQIQVVKLRRDVEMFQWVEDKRVKQINEADQPRSVTLYTYRRQWSPELIDSNDFDDSETYPNPVVMPVYSKTYTVDKVYVGNFLLSENIKDKIDDYKEYKLFSLPDGVKDAQLYQGYIYHGRDPSHPQIGDVRVKFSYTGVSGTKHSTVYVGPQQKVSIIAKQVGASLSGYQTYSGESIELIQYGHYSAKEMFAKEEKANSGMAWSLRFVGCLIFAVAIVLMNNVVTLIISWIPLVQELAKLNSWFFVIGISYSLTAIIAGLAWIAYRPLLTLGLLISSLVPLIIALRKKGHRKRSTNIL